MMRPRRRKLAHIGSLPARSRPSRFHAGRDARGDHDPRRPDRAAPAAAGRAGRAREAARRGQCANNLGQLATARPPTITTSAARCQAPRTWWRASRSVHPRPAAPGADPALQRGQFRPRRLGKGENVTIAGFAIGGLMCPSDTGSSSVPIERTSWRPTSRPGPGDRKLSSYGGSARGPAGGWSCTPATASKSFPRRLRQYQRRDLRPVRLRLTEISDGTSNTTLFAERAHDVLTSSTTVLQRPEMAAERLSFTGTSAFPTTRRSRRFTPPTRAGRSTRSWATTPHEEPGELPRGRRQCRVLRRFGPVRRGDD